MYKLQKYIANVDYWLTLAKIDDFDEAKKFYARETIRDSKSKLRILHEVVVWP